MLRLRVQFSLSHSSFVKWDDNNVVAFVVLSDIGNDQLERTITKTAGVDE